MLLHYLSPWNEFMQSWSKAVRLKWPQASLRAFRLAYSWSFWMRMLTYMSGDILQMHCMAGSCKIDECITTGSISVNQITPEIMKPHRNSSQWYWVQIQTAFKKTKSVWGGEFLNAQKKGNCRLTGHDKTRFLREISSFVFFVFVFCNLKVSESENLMVTVHMYNEIPTVTISVQKTLLYIQNISM